MPEVEPCLHNYFIEEVVNDSWTGNFRLITDAWQDEKGYLHIAAADESWREEEALRYTRHCATKGVLAPTEELSLRQVDPSCEFSVNVNNQEA